METEHLSTQERMRRQVEKKIIDFDEVYTDGPKAGKYKWAPKEGTVEVIPVRVKKNVDPNWTFACYRNPETGEMFGIPLKMNPDGEFVFKKIIITGSRSFNLTNPEERKEFILIKYWERCIDSPWRSNTALVKIYDPIAEAEANIAREVNADRAKGIAMSFIKDHELKNEMLGFSRLFGFNPVSEHIKVIQSELLNKAKTEPVKFLEKWDDSESRRINIIIRRGIDTGDIEFVVGKGYVYNGVVIAINEQLAVSYFRSNLDDLRALDLNSKERDKSYDRTLDRELNTIVDAKMKSIEESHKGVAYKKTADEIIDEEHSAGQEKMQQHVSSGTASEGKNSLEHYQGLCKSRKYPESEWAGFSTIGDITEYMTLKASGG